MSDALSEADAAEGRTLSQKPIEDVRREAAELQSEMESAADQHNAMVSWYVLAVEKFNDLLWWPPAAAGTFETYERPDLLTEILRAEQELAMARAALAEAIDEWVAEEERKESERRRIASIKQQKKAPTITVSAEQASIEAFLLALEPRIVISWDANLCTDGYICGTTLLGGAIPTVNLDPDIVNFYLTDPGKYVLIHEAAHAKSWYFYGSIEALGAASVALTGFLPEGPQDPGRKAIEWMADCATFAHGGFTGVAGAYTSSCTPEQIAEASQYW